MNKFGRASFPSPIIYSCSPKATPSDVGGCNACRITGVVYESSQTKGEVILDLVVSRSNNSVGFDLSHALNVRIQRTGKSRSARGSAEFRIKGTKCAGTTVRSSSSCSGVPQSRASNRIGRRNRRVAVFGAGTLSEEVGGAKPAVVNCNCSRPLELMSRYNAAASRNRILAESLVTVKGVVFGTFESLGWDRAVYDRPKI